MATIPISGKKLKKHLNTTNEEDEMKINVIPNLYIMGFGDRYTIETSDEIMTLRELLNDFIDMCRDKIKMFDESGNLIKEDFKLIINDKEISGTAEDLNMYLKDDDTVKIWFETLGG